MRKLIFPVRCCLTAGKNIVQRLKTKIMKKEDKRTICRQADSSRIKQKIGFGIISLCMFTTVLFLFAIICFIGVKGIRVISWEFLTQAPRDSMTAGGVAPAIVGTICLTLGAVLFSFRHS